MSENQHAPWAAILPRRVLAIRGPDTHKFLQGLISNDIGRAVPGRLVYAFLLTPQGKYLYDFIIQAADGGVDIDVAEADAPGLAAKLIQYKLRSKVTIEEQPALCVAALSGAAKAGALTDPRLDALGLRIALPRAEAEALLAAAGFTVRDTPLYETHRIALGVPDHHDFAKEQSFLLECNGEELHGVDFRKGCYVGQELTARMKHRGTARRRILRVAGQGVTPGAIVLDGARETGAVLSVAGSHGLALIRLDRWREAQGRALTANGQAVEVSLPAYPLHLPPEEAAI
jgi:hypothetical protein